VCVEQGNTVYGSGIMKSQIASLEP